MRKKLKDTTQLKENPGHLNQWTFTTELLRAGKIFQMYTLTPMPSTEMIHICCLNAWAEFMHLM